MYYSYSAAQWLLVFYLYCMLGWCFESTVVSVGQRRLVNRGFLRGPMLPIYGFGAVILLHVSLPLKQHPVWLYLASMIAATVFEYIVGVVMEKIFKVNTGITPSRDSSFRAISACARHCAGAFSA